MERSTKEDLTDSMQYKLNEKMSVLQCRCFITQYFKIAFTFTMYIKHNMIHEYACLFRNVAMLQCAMGNCRWLRYVNLFILCCFLYCCSEVNSISVVNLRIVFVYRRCEELNFTSQVEWHFTFCIYYEMPYIQMITNIYNEKAITILHFGLY